MKKTPTISVALPVYNEANNLLPILLNILQSPIHGYVLTEIIVVSDGSTDQTNNLVKKISQNYPVIRLIEGKQRLGKVARLNQIYRLFQGDILGVFDGDIHLPTGTLPTLVNSLMVDDRRVLVAAHQLPLRGRSLVSRAIHAGYRLWDQTRLSINQADHIQNFYGAATVYRGTFARSLQIPSIITDERGYIYLKAKEQGRFYYEFTAPIYYWPVQTVAEFWKLGDRSFSPNIAKLTAVFGPSVKEQYQIPTSKKLRAILLTFIEDPIFTFLGICLNLGTRLIRIHDRQYSKGMWEVSDSTKKNHPEYLCLNSLIQ